MVTKRTSNKLSFGEHIAVIWRELVEHLNTLSSDHDDDDELPQDQHAASATGAEWDGGK